MSEILERASAAVKLDFKVSEEGVFTGYGSTFGNVDDGNDVMLPGAFLSSLKKRGPMGVKMLWMHCPDDPIGVWETIEEDKNGLKVQGRLLLSIQKAREIYDLMKAGIVDSLSVGFRTVKATYDTAMSARKLQEVDLWEISPVTFAMNSQAKIQMVKGGLELPTRKEMETLLRNEGGFSIADARKAAAVLRKSLRNGEEEPAKTLRNEDVRAVSSALENLMRSIRS